MLAEKQQASVTSKPDLDIHLFTQERKKQIFDKVATYAQVKNKDYRFVEVPGNHGVTIKYLYFGTDLVGIG